MSFQKHIDESARALQSLTAIREPVESAAGLVLSTLKAGGKILTCGNGGSAAEAQHLATELMGRYSKSRKPLPAIALTADGSLLTCIGNDFRFEDVFSRQIAALAQPKDLLVAISSSGNSPNIVAALAEAGKLKLKSIALLGRGGGKCKGLATVDVIVPGDSGRTAQEAHLALIHFFCEQIDATFD